ncbi:MAG: polysaccharide deacetylase family protein [Bacillaceae bacterium]
MKWLAIFSLFFTLMNPILSNENRGEKVFNQEYYQESNPNTTYDEKEKKIVYLTIDDGPTLQTPKFLDVLKRYGVKATFFLIGSNISGNEKVIKRMKREGHYIGLHSMTHDYKKLYSEGEIIKEMKTEQRLLKRILGYSPVLFRSPYGSISGMTKALRDEAVNAHLKMWDWTIDSSDWRHQDDPEEILKEIEGQLTNKMEVILIHDRPATLSVLPEIIEMIKKKGYTFEVYREYNHFPLNFWNDPRL